MLRHARASAPRRSKVVINIDLFTRGTVCVALSLDASLPTPPLVRPKVSLCELDVDWESWGSRFRRGRETSAERWWRPASG